MLASIPAFADETLDAEHQAAPTEAFSSAMSLSELRYASRWRLQYPVEAEANWQNAPPILADLDFEQASPIARLSKLRNLSILTLAETRKTRLFIGVNDDGVAGLHFSAVPRISEGRFLEFARMPYLVPDEADRTTASAASKTD